jgi:hypothetical protein
LESDAALKKILTLHHNALEAWWGVARDDFAQLRDGKKGLLVTLAVIASFFVGVPIAEAALIGGSLLLLSHAVSLGPLPKPDCARMGSDGRDSSNLSRVSLLWLAGFLLHTKRLGPLRRGRPPPRSRILRKAYSAARAAGVQEAWTS